MLNVIIAVSMGSVVMGALIVWATIWVTNKAYSRRWEDQ